MKRVMPQEIAVWYLIPALRRELSLMLTTDFNMSQKDAAQALGITDSAISQYLSKKRGSDLKFNKKEKDKIRGAAEKITKNKTGAMYILYQLSNELMGTESLCKLHKKIDPTIAKKCAICSKCSR